MMQRIIMPTTFSSSLLREEKKRRKETKIRMKNMRWMEKTKWGQCKGQSVFKLNETVLFVSIENWSSLSALLMCWCVGVLVWLPRRYYSPGSPASASASSFLSQSHSAIIVKTKRNMETLFIYVHFFVFLFLSFWSSNITSTSTSKRNRKNRMDKRVGKRYRLYAAQTYASYVCI